MINIKTNEEIEIMQLGGEILADVLFKVLEHAKVGVSELELDKLAEELILKAGGEPGFKKVANYNHTICVSTNNVVVHGIPTNYKFKKGDVVGIDCGVYFKGFHTDAAHTVRVKSFPPQRDPSSDGTKFKVQSSDGVDRFLETGKKALEKGIEQAKIGNRVGHISKAIQDTVEGKGYSIVRSLVGHGVGRKLHEDPEVPGFLNVPIQRTPLLKEGMTIAIEVIYNMGKRDVVYANNDGWTIKTKDGSISGLFERTVAITKESPRILTV
ncbi:MAG: type I methionyl aminopeptidase [Candidatus Levybacteria bacterium]|nr:type I methionyl aminopeptidase [Candidatus Levybacteria bacterium]